MASLGRSMRTPCPANRSRSCCGATSTIRPGRTGTSTSSAGACCPRRGCCGRRRSPIDPFLLRGASLGRGLARGTGRRRGGRLPHGRCRAAADRFGPADRGHPARPRSVGAARGVRPVGDVRGSDSACGPSSCARRPRSSWRAQALARAARRVLHIRADRLRVVPLAPRPAFTLAVGSDAARLAADSARERERLGLPDRYLVYSGRYDARQDLGTLLRALVVAGRGRAARRALRGRDLAAAHPARRGEPGRSSLAGPRRRPAGHRRAASPTPRRCSPVAVAGLVRGARAAILPVVSDAAGPGGDRGDRVWDAGRGVRGRGLARPRRRAGHPGRAAGSRSASPSPCARSGPTIASTSGSRRTPASVPTWQRRTWADVARETRAIYAEVGIPRIRLRDAAPERQPAGDADAGRRWPAAFFEPALNETG